jgi:hypothetical protein
LGGGASLAAAIYTQRYQDRLQRVAREVTKAGIGLRRVHHVCFEAAAEACVNEGFTLNGMSST